VGPFDHPWLSGLFADPEMAAIWSAQTQLSHMCAFEAAWSRSGHLAGLWAGQEGTAAAKAIEGFTLDPKDLAEGTAHDGLCVPSLVRFLKAVAGDAVHRGATSQDVIDTALALCIAATLDLVDRRLAALADELAALEGRFGDAPLMGRTRMQAALPIHVRDRVRIWRSPLSEHRHRIQQLRPRVARIQIGGAAGDRAALGNNAQQMCDAVAAELGLESAAHSWHATRDSIAEFANLLSLISGSLGKFGQDVALMAQQGVDEISLSCGGGSSAMPHKQNPILAELLVSLARYNAVQLSGMHQALVHEQERSGAAWTLEWMLLPQMAQATGRALVAGEQLVGQINAMGTDH
jgi:3-carboxy-cis,cis-muconate cycloisomerase